ncbi:S53 family peptidase [Lentilactobacillus hilgardii]|nr:S53 family peptidase [Lentilactobacillus hilgardii]MCV3740518.1 S53 family peptidase [Lentilactobacillus hilgardii]
MQKQTLKKLIAMVTFVLAFTILIGVTNGTPVSAKSSTTNVSGSKQQLVDIVLKPKSQKKLDQFVYQSVDPTSTNYRKFVSSGQFASKFGQSTKNIQKLRQYLKKYHLRTEVYRGNLVMAVKGSTRNVQKAFKVKLVMVSKNKIRYQKATKKPTVPKSVSKSVLAIMGLSNYSTVSKSSREFRPSSLYNRAATTLSQGEIAKHYSPSKFVNRYGISQLYNNGSTGRSKTIGIISFANYHPSDAYRYWNGMGIDVKSSRLSNYRTNGYKGSWNGYNETTIDVEQAGAIAPDSNIRTYIGKSDITGMVNSLAAAVGQNVVDVLSLSWGQSEAQVAYEIKQGVTPAKYNQIMNLLFEQAAAQGISVFAASGDNGAYDGISGGNTSLSVDTPANSPYVTAVGGTTLPRTYTVNKQTVKIEKERAWASEFLYPNYKSQKFLGFEDWVETFFAGGGGGFSKYNAVPKYQSGFSGIGTYDATRLWSFKNGKAKLLDTPVNISGKSQGRNVPDLSANADPNTGYSIFITPKKDSSATGEWEISGGTSVVAPQIAAASILMSNNSAGRLGFWNPQIYRFASQSNSPFTVLDSRTNNTNLYYTGQPGKRYNQATGLGTADFSKLDKLFNS